MSEERAVEARVEMRPADGTELSVGELIARRRKMLEVIRSVMKEGIHYGVIPGCEKQSLYQAGAEVLFQTFCLRPRLHIESIGEAGEIAFRVTAEVVHWPSEKVVGEGVGECSSEEEKYAWHEALCEKEWEIAEEADRRIKFKKTWSGPKGQRISAISEVKQVRINPKSVANTVLKMAAKRCRVDGAKSTTGASDIFGQDIEDIVDVGIEPADAGEGEGQQPIAKSAPPADKKEAGLAAGIPEEEWERVLASWHENGTITEKQVNRLFAIATKAGWAGDDVAELIEKHLGVKPSGLPYRGPYEAVVTLFDKYVPRVPGAK